MRKSRLTRSFATGRITVSLATDAEHLTNCDVDGALMDFWSSLVENVVIPQVNHLSADSYPLPSTDDEVAKTEYKQSTEATLVGGETLRVKIKLVSNNGIKRSTLAFLVGHLIAEAHVTVDDIEEYQTKIKTQATAKQYSGFGTNMPWNPPGFSNFPLDADLFAAGVGSVFGSNKPSSMASLARAIFGDDAHVEVITDPEEIKRHMASIGLPGLSSIFGSGLPGFGFGKQG